MTNYDFVLMFIPSSIRPICCSFLFFSHEESRHVIDYTLTRMEIEMLGFSSTSSLNGQFQRILNSVKDVFLSG